MREALINPLDYEISPGYKPTGFLENDKQPAIPGTGGRILAVWCVSTLTYFKASY